MKKILYLFILFLVFIGNVKAFDIDMSKVKINSKSEELINNLDSRFYIDTGNFNNKIIKDNIAVNLASKIVDISFKDKSVKDIKKDLNKYIYISDTDGFETLSGVMFVDLYLNKINDSNIELGRIKDIKSATLNEDVIVFIYVEDTIVNKKKTNMILSYWFKKDENDYKLYYPWISFGNELEEYFQKIGYIEETNKIIGDSYNKLSLDGNKNYISNDKLLNIYNDNIDSVVQITSMSDGNYNYGSGFFIREGVVVTTWSLFLEYLTEGDYLYVNDSKGKTYNVLGVVSADPEYDVVLLKINDEVGKPVTLSKDGVVNSSDKLFTINSKNNDGFSINYGSNISNRNGRLVNLFALSTSDVGSALFNEYNEVVGINVGDKLYSELSYANSVKYLDNVQSKLLNTKYNKVTYTVIDKFKKKYYIGYSDEMILKTVRAKDWDELNDIGMFEENISMELIKSSYKDGILSLRYKNTTSGMLDSIYLASPFTEKLIEQGYELTYYNKQKTIYKNENYQVILKDNFDYLIVLVMEI